MGLTPHESPQPADNGSFANAPFGQEAELPFRPVGHRKVTLIVSSLLRNL